MFAFTPWRKMKRKQRLSGGACLRKVYNHTYLKQPESDQIAAWASRGAGLFTDETLQTVRDPTSLSAQR